MKTTFSAAALVIGALFSQAALAHAHLKTQTPAADSTVEASPQSLTLTFSENIEPAFSGVNITDARQQPVPAGKAALDSAHHNQLNVALEKPLASGSYQVDWHVLSIDGHKTKGSYRFSVK